MPSAAKNLASSSPWKGTGMAPPVQCCVTWASVAHAATHSADTASTAPSAAMTWAASIPPHSCTHTGTHRKMSIKNFIYRVPYTARSVYSAAAAALLVNKYTGTQWRAFPSV